MNESAQGHTSRLEGTQNEEESDLLPILSQKSELWCTTSG